MRASEMPPAPILEFDPPHSGNFSQISQINQFTLKSENESMRASYNEKLTEIEKIKQEKEELV